MEDGPASGPERDAWVAKRSRGSAGVALLLAGVCLGAFLASVLAGAPRPGCYYNDGVRDTMKSAIDAGVAEIHEYEAEHARGRKSKRQEFRWKKCPDSTRNGVK